MPLLTRQYEIAAKAESTAGTPVALAAADATVNVFDPEFEPTINMVERYAHRAPVDLAALRQSPPAV